MAYRYPKTAIKPHIEHYDGHTIVVEPDGEELLWYVNHPPTCKKIQRWGCVTDYECIYSFQLDSAGSYAFGEVKEDNWPEEVPVKQGEWPLGFLIDVYSNYYLGDEVDIWLIIAKRDINESVLSIL